MYGTSCLSAVSRPYEQQRYLPKHMACACVIRVGNEGRGILQDLGCVQGEKGLL